eukprot:568044-Amphidinium_carterae.1
MDIEREQPPSKSSYRRTMKEDDDVTEALTRDSELQRVQGRSTIVYDLIEKNLEYLTHLPGDADEDATRIRQIEALEDDIQSIDDDMHYKKRRQEEIDYPEQTYWHRSKYEGHHEEMMESYRWESARDRQIRRDEGRQT